MEIFNGDCLDKMKDLKDDSIDLIFCDLPYGQTSCKWDCKIDLQLFWKEIMRIKKLHTPIFFTTTTKFGVELITSAPKKCYFRYDIVWVKSAPAGFLSAKKMPMRKHEMIYVFYEKLPFYDLSSHKHKFLKESEPPLPVSVIKEPPEPKIIKDTKLGTNTYDTEKRKKPILRLSDQAQYEPPLPVSVVKEIDNNNKEEQIYDKEYLEKKIDFKGRKGEPRYEPPLPVSVVKEKLDVYDAKERFKNGKLYKNPRHLQKGDDPIYDPPLPTTMLEIKSTRGKHSTEKPVALMEWILKYYSKEGDVVLDPTMGSGSTGIACKNMNRNFIGIEKDKEIFDGAVKRLN